MRPPRSLLAVIGLIAALALPAAAQAATPVRAVGFQAKVRSVNAKTGLLKARILTVLTTSKSLSKYKNKTLTFNIKGLPLNIVDRNKDGKGNEMNDILKNDLVGILATVSKTGPLPNVITAKSLQDLTALQTTPTLPGVPTVPTIPIPGLPKNPAAPTPPAS